MGCRPLGECIKSVIDHRGLTPKKLGGDWAHSGHRALSAKNIKNGALVQEGSMNRVSDEMYYRWMTEEVERGDVFITSEAPFGEVLYWDSDEKLVLSQRIFGLKVNRDVCDSRYLYYWMRSPLFQGELRGRATGTTVTGLRQPELLKCMVNLPPRDAQAAIAHILGTIDDKIALNNRINGYLEELLLAKYDKLFSVNADFTGILSDVGTIIGGATPSKKRSEYYCSNGIGWITPRDLSNTSDKFIAHGTDDITDEGYASCSAKLLPKGSVLFSSRAPIGYIAIAADAVATNQGFKSIVPKEEIGTAFVYCFLVRNKQRIADMGAGTTFPEVSGKMMKSVELAIPEQTLCAEFDFFAGPILRQQEALERENRELAALRDVLLPKLMSGEIDVSQVDLTQINSHLPHPFPTPICCFLFHAASPRARVPRASIMRL